GFQPHGRRSRHRAPAERKTAGLLELRSSFRCFSAHEGRFRGARSPTMSTGDDVDRRSGATRGGTVPEPEEPQQVDTTRPNAARMYDYYLGGSANFAVDREAADTAAHVVPDAVAYAQANRAFLDR